MQQRFFMRRLYGCRQLKHKIKSKFKCTFRLKWLTDLANEKRNATNDIGKYEINTNILKIHWDKWGTEIFTKINEIYYNCKNNCSSLINSVLFISLLCVNIISFK